MQTIIRVEHPADGKGMFNSYIQTPDGEVEYRRNVYKGLEPLFKRHQDSFPTPQEDGEYDMESDDFCAFKNIEQIQQWIKPKEFKLLSKAGFKMLMIDVTTCIELANQIIYKKYNILQSKDITSLFI